MKAEFYKRIKNKQFLLQNIKNLENRDVLVGIPAEKSYRKGEKITNAEIGYINEFGSPKRNIPARPFLIPSIESHRKELAKIMKPAISADSKKIKTDLEKAGLFASSMAKKWIRDQTNFKPLSPKTIMARKRKRKNREAGEKALIDTGSLINSITFVVVGNK